MQRIDILWRDIPSQVLIKRGRDRGKYMSVSYTHLRAHET